MTTSLINLHALLADAPATTTALAPNPTGSMVSMFAQIAIIGVLFYVLLIRPQSKKAKEQAVLLKSLKAGDKVITSSGIVGVVVSVKDENVTLRSADTKLEILKSSVTDIRERSSSGSSSSES